MTKDSNSDEEPEWKSHDILSRLPALRNKVPWITGEKGTFRKNGISVFRDPYGSVRYLYSIEGCPVACLQIVVKPKSDVARVANLYVRYKYRRTGLATRLLLRVQKDYRRVIHSKLLSQDGIKWLKGLKKKGINK